MTSRDTEPHVGSSPEAIWLSGFAIVAAPTKLPKLTRWIAVWHRGCGCTTHYHLRGSNTVGEILNQGGSLDDYDAYHVQPIDPT